MKVNPICPGVFLSDHGPGGHIVPPLCVNADRKKVLHDIWHSHTLQCYKKMIEKIFKIAATWMMASLIMSNFLKNYAKNG